ncbi:hypothetical protein Tco_1509647 [Tanacetum coccineum]
MAKVIENLSLAAKVSVKEIRQRHAKRNNHIATELGKVMAHDEEFTREEDKWLGIIKDKDRISALSRGGRLCFVHEPSKKLCVGVY